MRERFGLRRSVVGLATVAVLGAVLILGVGGAFGSGAAAYTTWDATQGGCLDGPNGVNCNNYLAKEDVYVNGGPTNGAGLPAGTYYFSVLVPGYQHDGFIDGHKGNLSDTTTGGTTGDLGSGDSYLCRELTVDASGGVTYAPDSSCGSPHIQGTDIQQNTVTQLMPYDDTSNGGGVYIMAICKVGATSSSDCKFDAFKVTPGGTPCTTDCPTPAADLTVSKDATPSLTETYGWDSAKSVDPSGTVDTATDKVATYTATATWSGPTPSDWQVTGTITVTNPNGFDVAGVNVSDVISSGGSADAGATCSVTDSSNNPATSETIGANDAVEFSYTCTYGSSGPASNSESNVATATWDKATYGTPSGSASNDPVSVTFNDGSAGNPTVVGDSETVIDTFNGSSTADILGTVDVNGNFDTSKATVTELSGYPTYDSTTQTYTFKYQRTLTVVLGTCTTYPNTVGIDGLTDPTPKDNDASVTLCGGADLKVDKTATPSYKRTYNWTIAKNVDKTTVTNSSGSATFNYTVTVTQTGFTDSLWKVTGTITVSNPNDWESVTLTGVSDSIDHSGSCSINASDVSKETATLAPKGQTGDSTTLGYTCTFTSNPGSGTNTATATWSASAAYTPDGTKSGTAAYDFSKATVTTVNQTVTPTDAFNGGTGVNLCTLDTSNPPCTLTATDKAPFTSQTYHYSRTVTVTGPLTCQSFSNTASIPGGSSSKTVTVCFQAPLTMGYWKNHAANSNSKGAFYSSDCSKLKSSSCNTQGPYAIQYLSTIKLGTYPVSGVLTILLVDPIWGLANCSTNTDQGAIACLVGQLLAAKLNVANGSNTCINTTIGNADTFLAGLNPPYSGASWKPTNPLTSGQRTTALNYQNALNKYNNNQGC